MKKSTTGALIFICIIVLAFMIGSYILTATFFGLLTLCGLIALIESISPLKWALSRSTRIIDILLFVCTIFATMNYGLNIAASLTVAGIGYTLVYAPYLREQRLNNSNKPKARFNLKTKFNNK